MQLFDATAFGESSRKVPVFAIDIGYRVIYFSFSLVPLSSVSLLDMQGGLRVFIMFSWSSLADAPSRFS